MSQVINTDTTIDYFSVIHRNLYRMKIEPDQRAGHFASDQLIEFVLCRVAAK